ncbi:DUF3383 family protein [Lentilactobacillus parabuchneri]|uniref:DUF3383 family protein n=1 Tax=Lentilactobacillus parabuchneri TaxID=152331 RepID=UPI0023081F51|nr:DUF3383 family protein [Lentilactobacillus parabuchneri]MDB1104631.1 DUF3383 family protein [Lentilactobacillus parabuchneri]
MPVIPKITDVFVTLNVNHPVPQKSLKNTAIFVKGTTQAYKEYADLDSIEADFDATTSVYKTAQTMLGQDPYPELIPVITYVQATQAPAPGVQTTPTSNGATVTTTGDTAPTAGIAKAAYDYFYNNWEFAVLADYNKDDALALADLIETGSYDAKGFHILFLQFDKANQADADAFAKYTRTFTFYHTDDSEYYAAALAAKGGQPTVGSISWKFVGNLADVTPENVEGGLLASDIDALTSKHLITYVTKGNANNQTDDVNAAGMYIDTVHGMDWTKSNIESSVQNTLNGSGDGTKLPFSPVGLATIKQAIDSVLSQGYNQGIVRQNADTGKPDFGSNVPGITEISPKDWQERNLKGLTFQYGPDGAVNKVHINGGVDEAY